LKSQQTEDELLDGARTNPTGIQARDPICPEPKTRDKSGSKQNVRKELKMSNYEVPKTIRNVKEAAGHTRASVRRGPG